ncbi:MAG TPA: EF-P lysine aminoacylase EpmA [Pirellulales bacterium]|nr:EF-P lysine aminoacylase EpmA [Pirellulales bacterium]
MLKHNPRDFRPAASWPMLKLRAKLLARLRRFFDERGFLEVETPILSADVVVDRHLDPFAVDVGEGAARRTMWLQTSPEFAMKRLLAAGGSAIYQVTHVFRRGEQGRMHNPEFTMAEWYRAGDDLRAGMQLLGELCQEMLELGPAETISYQAAFERHAGVNPHEVSVQSLAEVLKQRGRTPPESLGFEDRDSWLDLVLVELVEPELGQSRPQILYDYPASQAALARVRPGPPAVAERFELYVRGIELANGYHELLDPAVLRERNRANNRARVSDAKQTLPEESRLLAAMEAGLPSSSGVALGFDRLVMVAAGAGSLAEVLPFPFDRA